ncbi:MAG TPA: hypothetical protein VEH84_17955 [Alphaproteobacteria bacterium]|nr:hypothetical protein [Alphaproteobacteria bacterium]
MPIKLESFSNVTGGNALFKALSHPLAAPLGHALLERLAGFRSVAVYDPADYAEAVAEFFPFGGVKVGAVFAQNIERLGRPVFGRTARPVTELPDSGCDAVFIAAFDSDRLLPHIRHLIPAGAEVLSLDAMRIPAEMLTVPGNYLAPLNFATNFAFFRDGEDQHTRVVTADYWHAYGAGPDAHMALLLLDGAGQKLAQWTEALPGANATVTLDSREVRARFGLGPFCGQLFIHVVGAAGHDIVKYALDTYGDRAETLSCTHDANAWPADLYGGLPAPGPDERVVLWIQNSLPSPIPAGTVGLNRMGRPEIVRLERDIPAYGTYALDTAELLPGLRWPEQIEVQAGKHFVRPRYEVLSGNGRVRIAHANVERTDLKPDRKLPELGPWLGKGFILPAPVLPTDRFRSIALPTPMSTAQTTLPLQVAIYDSEGREAVRRPLGCLPRDHALALTAEELLDGRSLAGGYGHMELTYDFSAGHDADGWLHALFRYEDRRSGHGAETSFGAHVFNIPLVYKGEPQSYAGRPPGLSTRLFLRLGLDGTDAFCHLIYPASQPWHARSDTALILTDKAGREVARKVVQIACSGSHLFRASETFASEDLARAAGGYVLIRDTTCRLFGYHGLMNGDTAFALDHMFGF